MQGVCLPWPRLVCGNAGARLGKVVVAGTQAWWLQLTGGQVTRFLSRLFNFGWIRVHTVRWAVQWWPLSRGQQTICPQLTQHDTSHAQRFACRDKKTYLIKRAVTWMVLAGFVANGLWCLQIQKAEEDSVLLYYQQSECVWGVVVVAVVVCAAHVNLYSEVLSRLIIIAEYFHTHLGLAAAGTFSTKYLDTNYKL